MGYYEIYGYNWKELSEVLRAHLQKTSTLLELGMGPDPTWIFSVINIKKLI